MAGKPDHPPSVSLQGLPDKIQPLADTTGEAVIPAGAGEESDQDRHHATDSFLRIVKTEESD
jgi:hypothetical protein